MTPQLARAASAASIGTVIALGRLEAVMYCTSYLRCGHPASQGLGPLFPARGSAEIDSRRERIGFLIDGCDILSARSAGLAST